MKYSYKCKQCGEITELIRKIAEHADPVTCECGGDCSQVILHPPVLSFDPISGDHVIATSKWEKHREQKMAKEKKNMENHGTVN